MRNLYELDSYRLYTPEVAAYYGGVGDNTCGVFCVHSQVDTQPMMIVASSDFGWEHVSVSLQYRTPYWEEMSSIKEMFFNPYETAIQFHVPEDKHINCHPNCLHLWRPLEQVIILPPPELVGPA